MQKRIVIALAALWVASGALAGERGTWVSEEGHTIDLHPGHEMMFIEEEGGEAFDLSDLRDGETRTFGQGVKQVTATRLGDVVTLSRSAEGDGKALEVKCTVPQDSCRVMTFADQPEKVMVIVEKRRECINGVGDCDMAVDVDVEHLHSGGAQVHAIVRKVECDDAGNCEEIEQVMGPGAGAVKIVGEAGPHGNVMILRAEASPDGQVLLRCPEGDSTVHVAAEEAGETFLCPKHSVPMEKAPANTFIRKKRVQQGD